MSVHIQINDPLYRTCEVYIDNQIFHGKDEDDFVTNTREIFHVYV